MRVLAFVVLVSFSSLVLGNTYIYVNDNALYDLVPGNANTVSAFRLNADGSLTAIAGSPFFAHTDNFGCWAGYVAPKTIITVGNYLYVSNCFYQTISGFSIDPTTGVLALLPGASTALLPQSSFQPDIPLVATPDGAYLVAVLDPGAGSTTDLHVFSISGTGALSEVVGSPFPAACPFVVSTTISPNGSFLAASCPALDQILVFAIGAGGTLTPVPGSPFSAGAFPPGIPMSLEFDAASAHLFVGVAALSITGIVAVYDIAANGSITPIAGSPFQLAGAGLDSQFALLGADGNFLFVSNQDSASITSYTVAANGSLALVAGSPFSGGGLVYPAGMDTNPLGTFLFVVDLDYAVRSFSIAGDGTLAYVASAPTNPQGSPLSLTVWSDDLPEPPGTGEAQIDIKLCSNPNGYNCRAKGVVPVTIFGTTDLDVNGIDISSLRLCRADQPDSCTAAPKSWSFSDRGDPGLDMGSSRCAVINKVEQHFRNPDGLTDLDAAFNNEQVSQLIGCDSLTKKATSPTLFIKGQTTGGEYFESTPIGNIGVDQLSIQQN